MCDFKVVTFSLRGGLAEVEKTARPEKKRTERDKPRIAKHVAGSVLPRCPSVKHKRIITQNLEYFKCLYSLF